MKHSKRGATGLTQKEAIFQIFKKVLDAQFKPGLDVHDILCSKLNDYGRAKWKSTYLNRIVFEISEGLANGSIPSKLNSTPEGVSERDLNKLRLEYANRITHYWMKHDKRLNGGVSGTRARAKQRVEHQILLQPDPLRQRSLKVRLQNDPQLKAIRELLAIPKSTQDSTEIAFYISARSFEIILESFEISSSALLHELLDVLRTDNVTCKTNNESRGSLFELEHEYKIAQSLKNEGHTAEEIEFILYGKSVEKKEAA